MLKHRYLVNINLLKYQLYKECYISAYLTLAKNLELIFELLKIDYQDYLIYLSKSDDFLDKGMLVGDIGLVDGVEIVVF